MIGQLQEHPLAELIHEISTAGLSGALRLERDRVKVIVYFEAGELIYAISNLRPHRLAECVRRWRVASEQQLAAIGEPSSDMALASALSAAGIFTQQEIEALLSRQVAEILRLVLLWTNGTWQFEARARLTEDVRVKLEMRELLMESARRLPADFVATRLPNGDEKLSLAATAPTNINLLPAEGFILSRADIPITLHELVIISGRPEADALSAIYALVISGLLRRNNWPCAFSKEETAKALAVAKVVRGKPAQVKATSLSPQASTTTAKEKSGVEMPAASANTESDIRREVAALFARLSAATDHYQVLNVSRNAEPSEIKRAYHSLAKRFHPDRFHSNGDTDLHARIEAAFAQMAQAYETLKDRPGRAAYDLKLNAQKETSPNGYSAPTQEVNQGANAWTNENRDGATHRTAARPSSAQGSGSRMAEEQFQQGLAALQQGNRALAVTLLGEAARLAPEQPRYRAHYGHVLAANEQTRRQAEAEINAAIALDANNALYRIMLAELYRDIGLYRRAQGEAERALALDPQNGAARRLLNSLQSPFRTGGREENRVS